MPNTLAVYLIVIMVLAAIIILFCVTWRTPEDEAWLYEQMDEEDWLLELKEQKKAPTVTWPR